MKKLLATIAVLFVSIPAMSDDTWMFLNQKVKESGSDSGIIREPSTMSYTTYNDGGKNMSGIDQNGNFWTYREQGDRGTYTNLGEGQVRTFYHQKN